MEKIVLSGLGALPDGAAKSSLLLTSSQRVLRCFCFSHPSCVHQPCGKQDSCPSLLLDHADVVNCTSIGPGLMKCAITCQRGFALQASGGQYIRPMQVSGKIMITRTKFLGKGGIHALLSGSTGKEQMFLSHLKGKHGGSNKQKEGWLNRNARYIKVCTVLIKWVLNFS